MNFRRRQLTGWGIIFACTLLGGAWLLSLDFSKKISTDVLDLVPANEREPEITLVRQLASQAEARTMLMVLTAANGTPATPAAAVRFAGELARAPEFAQAVALGDTAARDALGRELFERRWTLLFPAWLEARRAEFAASKETGTDFSPWLARRSVERLNEFLSAPEALAFQDLLPADPLLLMPDAVAQLKGGLNLVQPAAGGEVAPALIWAQLAQSPLQEAGQQPAFAAIARVAADLAPEFPGLHVAYTGVNRYAAASRARIEKEVTWLNVLSGVAVLGVALVFIRGVHRALHLVPVVLLSTLGAWVCVTLAFDRVHILVFVLGSLLTGVAIDYGFYLYMQPPARPDEDYWAKVRRLTKPLLASCFTTVAGFALLVWSELPMIRQLGVFVGTGLVCALGAAVIYFSTVKYAFLEARAFRGEKALGSRVRKNIRRTLVVAWIAALPGLALLKWRDDIRELEIPSPALKREDAQIRAQFGQSDGQQVYLTYGANADAARAAVTKLNAWLREDDPTLEIFGLGAVIPTRADYAQSRRFLVEQKNFAADFRAELAHGGFDADSFAAFFESYAREASSSQTDDLDGQVRALAAKLTGPTGLLVHLGEPGELTWFVTLAGGAHARVPPKETSSVSVNQLESLNGVFARYRQSALWLSLTGLGIVGLGVFLTYGVRDGVRIFAIPLGACLGVFGVFGWIGQPLNLFHLLGAFLGVCLTHNYSIFSATSAYRNEAPPVSVRMSALTTAASFGVLALSGIPVVRALGLTVSCMVISALVLIEFEHLAKLRGK